jgi:hypothetical protein
MCTTRAESRKPRHKVRKCIEEVGRALDGGVGISRQPQISALRRRSSFGFDEDDEDDETVHAVVSRQEEPSRVGGL